MISKNEVKYIQSLSDKKNRNRDGVFVAEGPKVVSELLANGVSAKMIYTTRNTDDYRKENAEVTAINEYDLQRMSRLDTPNEVTGIFYKQAMPPFCLTNTVTLMLDSIRDPGNMGTIIRTADWFGIRQIIASSDSADCYNLKVVQSTMGSIARVAVYYEDLSAVLNKKEVRVLGALMNGNSLYNMNKLTEGILIIGNESKGIRSELLPFIQESVTIPRVGIAESLNAAVATGILLSYLAKN